MKLKLELNDVEGVINCIKQKVILVRFVRSVINLEEEKDNMKEKILNALFGKPCVRCGKRKKVKIEGEVYCWSCDKMLINNLMLSQAMDRKIKIR